MDSLEFFVFSIDEPFASLNIDWQYFSLENTWTGHIFYAKSKRIGKTKLKSNNSYNDNNENNQKDSIMFVVHINSVSVCEHG